MRQQIWAPMIKYLVQWATPSLAGFTPEGVSDISDLDDGESPSDANTKTPEEALLESLIQFQGGTAIALKGGSRLEPIQSAGNGEAFIQAHDMLRREIVLGILRVTRATLESQHGSKADSQTAQDMLNVFVAFIRRIVEQMMDRDVVSWLVDLNFGRSALQYAPRFVLSRVEREDVAKLADAIAKLWSAEYFDESQVPELDQKLGMPHRDFEAWQSRRRERDDALRMASSALAKTLNPGSEEEDV
jgi:phage gp29-like protein